MFYRVLGLMSGTSLDGLDMAYCEFSLLDNQWSYKIKKAKTIAYTKSLKEKIIKCETSTGEYLCYMSSFLGHYFGKQAFKFLKENNLIVDFVSSHGQTIFHQPEKGFTTQIGDINALASEVKSKVIGDFRSLDVALGGQGAPLVPIGDKLLFSSYDFCLNLGGFSNISFEKNKKRIAFDICPTNMVLNYLANKKQMTYDKDGLLAKKGKINENLLKELNSIPYYKDKIRKSLGKEFVKESVLPIIERYDISVEDKMATYLEHISIQLNNKIKGDVLITGGGAYNKFLIEKLKQKTKYNITIPDKTTIDFKEALIFAFLGVLRLREETNCLASVTGAMKDSCSGVIVQWNNK
jgi:anhydro-N-acetylmuramic acid kinase